MYIQSAKNGEKKKEWENRLIARKLLWPTSYVLAAAAIIQYNCETNCTKKDIINGDNVCSGQ